MQGSCTRIVAHDSNRGPNTCEGHNYESVTAVEQKKTIHKIFGSQYNPTQYHGLTVSALYNQISRHAQLSSIRLTGEEDLQTNKSKCTPRHNACVIASIQTHTQPPTYFLAT